VAFRTLDRAPKLAAPLLAPWEVVEQRFEFAAQSDSSSDVVDLTLNAVQRRPQLTERCG
jgi:hypothetical protein